MLFGTQAGVFDCLYCHQPEKDNYDTSFLVERQKRGQSMNLFFRGHFHLSSPAGLFSVKHLCVSSVRCSLLFSYQTEIQMTNHDLGLSCVKSEFL